MQRNARCLVGLCAALAMLAAGCGGGATPAGGAAGNGSGGRTGSAAAGSGAAKTASPVKATLLYPGLTSSHVIAWIADTAGYFKQNGLDIKEERVQGSSVASAALASGSAQFMSASGPAVILADSKGLGQIVLMTFIDREYETLYAAPGINTVQQLKGKAIGITKAGTADEFVMDEALAKWGMKPSDVRLLGVGTMSTRVAAYQKGLIQAMVMDAPYDLEAKKMGAHLLVNFATMNMPALGPSLVVSKTFLSAHPTAVAGAVKAMIEAEHRFLADPAYAKQVLTQYLKQSPADIADAYQNRARLFLRVPTPSIQGLQGAENELVALHKISHQVSVQSMADASFVDQLQKSGFIGKLYGTAGSGATSGGSQG